MHHPGFAVNPGVQGCGILLSNVSVRAMAACAPGWARLWRRAIAVPPFLMDSGALDFRRGESLDYLNRASFQDPSGSWKI
jgi:hypothetical protein